MQPDDPFEQCSTTDYLDSLCQEKLDVHPNVIIPWILMASYLYYIYDFSILSDGFFDKLCKTVMYQYDVVTHRHKDFVTPQRLAMGSLFDLMERDYPTITKDAALSLVYKHYGRGLRDGSRVMAFEDGTEIFVP